MVSISGENLLKGAKMVIALVMVLLFGAVSVLIGYLVAGTVADVATGGTISTEGNFTAGINNISETTAGYGTSIWSNWGLIVSLIAIVVIIAVFGITYALTRGSKGKGGMY